MYPSTYPTNHSTVLLKLDKRNSQQKKKKSGKSNFKPYQFTTKSSNYNMNVTYGGPVATILRNTVHGSLPATGALTPPPQHTEKNGTHVHINTNLIHTITVMGMKYISMFNGKPEFFVYRASIANTEIIILLLFNIIPF